MNLSAIAIKRPVFTVMVTLALMVLGLVGYSRLGTDLFPDVTFPGVVVTVPYPGASPAEVEQLVSKPLEDSVVSLNGIDRVRTFSREGSSTTFVIFKLGVDIQEAATEVRERVAQARYKLPQEVKEPAIARFDVLQDRDDPTRFVLVEVYRTPEGQAAHRATAHYAAWRAAVDDLMAEP
ncbi:MAG TPA: efflux RND transporter permease subunit, partial [Acidimicrobiales bacterium]|nr:efflux RND transporter permease subunit [Acidimicrobiales bacterium]